MCLYFLQVCFMWALIAISTRRNFFLTFLYVVCVDLSGERRKKKKIKLYITQ